MLTGSVQVPIPVNETVRDLVPGSADRDALDREFTRIDDTPTVVPLNISGVSVESSETFALVCPHQHDRTLATVHAAQPEHVERAIDAALSAWKDWSRMLWSDRIAICLRAAELLSTSHRSRLNAVTMLGQSKNAHQAEIDSACELIDFLRFNAHFAQEIYREQPSSLPGTWNSSDYRPLEGFVLAITPFNFTSIAANLALAPAMLGNVVLWKPSETQSYSAHETMKLIECAGFPPGVINLLPGSGPKIAEHALSHPALAGVNFTGSTKTFQSIWKTVGKNIANYRSYPRLVGETGGKDFIIAHRSANPAALIVAMIQGAYEYQGQKCSAASRAFLPRSLYLSIRDQLIAEIDGIFVGDPRDHRVFMGAMIDRRSFEKTARYLAFAEASAEATIIAGGTSDDRVGYFIRPTLVETRDPNFRLLKEEIFGPVLTVFIYEDNAFEEVLAICDEGSPYGLTGSIFARDRDAIDLSRDRLRYSAGNFYINDKPTGALVGQQPFGGSRASGTNDKAGSRLNLTRWLTPRTIKENFVPPGDYHYGYMYKTPTGAQCT